MLRELGIADVVSPGFTSRPSLSGDDHQRRSRPHHGVSPGFTSRPSLSGMSVFGLHLVDDVSPGFTSRPSLSAHERPAGRRELHVCRRDSRPGLR